MMKRIWTILMALLLLAASSAWAQIQVESARWQVIGGSRGCDAKRQLTDLCNGRTQCQVAVDPRFLCGGDPAPGRLKSLNVEYTCFGRPQPVLAFRDGTQAVLRCEANNQGSDIYQPQPPTGRDRRNESGKLQIFAARWEVIGGGASCDATADLVNTCDGKRFCQLLVDPRYLCNGDPAPGQEKRLDIRYACDGERQPPVAFKDFSEVRLRCGKRDGNNNPPLVAVVSVQSARWEAIGGGGFCDATRDMANACNGRSFCQLKVDPRNLCNGDPAPGRNKSLLIVYSCDGRQQTPIAYPDFAQAILRCDGQVIAQPPPPSRRGGVIKVQQAHWERIGGGGNCDATPQMIQACDGKSRCRVSVDPEHLCNGDPAPGELKSLDVQFSCDGRPQLPVSFPDFAKAILNCE
jgi:hypothetical protein